MTEHALVAELAKSFFRRLLFNENLGVFGYACTGPV